VILLSCKKHLQLNGSLNQNVEVGLFRVFTVD